MKRYREQLDEVEVEGDDPRAFCWRGRRYEVLQVLGHWHEDAGWWQRPDGATRRIERTDLWRVEAGGGGPSRGVYELVRSAQCWRLDRVWD
jgi:hypothetical protein